MSPHDVASHAAPGATAELVAQAAFHHVELVARARRELNGCGADPEDVVQDAYVQLLRRASDGDAPHAPRAWLHAVVRSLCAEERRRRARERPSELAELPCSTPGPEERAAMRAESRWLLGRIADLPDRERRAVVELMGGIAHGLDGTRNAVYQALHRGRTRLRAAREGVWAALIPFRLFVIRSSENLPVAGPPPSGRVAAALAAAAASLAAVGGVVVIDDAARPAHRPAHAAPPPAARSIVPAAGATATSTAATAIARTATRSTRAALGARRRGTGGGAGPAGAAAVAAGRAATAVPVAGAPAGAAAPPGTGAPLGAIENSMPAGAAPRGAGSASPAGLPAGKVVDIEGPVVAVAAGAVTIALDAHGQTVPQTVLVPAGVELGDDVSPGKKIKLKVSVAHDGTVTLLSRRDGGARLASAKVADMEGSVLAVTAGAVTVAVDVHGARVPQTVHVPAGVDAGGPVPGQTVKLKVSVAPDGRITLIARRDAGTAPKPQPPASLPAQPKVVVLDTPVLAVDPPSHGLVIAMEIHGARVPQRVWVPAGIDLGPLIAGRKAKLEVAIAADGTTTLVAIREAPKPPAAKVVDMDGTVVAVNPAARALAIAMDDHGDSVTRIMRVPAGVDLGGLAAGQPVKLKVSVAPDGSLALVARR